jgi:signal transduction histidine kinase
LTGPTTISQGQDASTSLSALPSGSGGALGRSRLPAAVLVGGWCMVALVHLLTSPANRTWTWPLGYLLLEALACASLAYRAWRTTGEERRAWTLLAASALLEVPNLLVTLLRLQQVMPPWSSAISSVLTLVTGVLVLGGVLSFPRGQEGRGTFLRRALDGLIFAASLVFLLWVMGVQSSLRTAGGDVGLRVFVAYLNVALLGGGLVFMTSYHPSRIQGPLGWLGASALAWLAALSAWTLAGLPSLVVTQKWILLAGAIPLFQGLAAWSPQPVRAPQPGLDLERRGAALLPYLPVSLAILALAAQSIWLPVAVTRGTFSLFLVMVVLLLLRQFQAIRDLQVARESLEKRVHQRTRALEQAQDTLLRTERMNTLALMGAGLAHDLNNLLCAMKGSAELAVLQLEEGQPVAPRDLTRLASTADRAASLTRRLMGYVRSEAEELTALDLGQELLQMEATLRLILPRSVRLGIEVPLDQALLVASTKSRLEQMLVNLVANARDAMPEGGRLQIRLRPGGSGAEQVVIEVVDSGTGMTLEIQEHIFDPFFTTKPPGKGTGLGLPSLKAMVEADGGGLEVASTPGVGSTFRILLPRLQVEAVSPR